jgi:hypothetical protein
MWAIGTRQSVIHNGEVIRVVKHLTVKEVKRHESKAASILRSPGTNLDIVERGLLDPTAV